MTHALLIPISIASTLAATADAEVPEDIRFEVYRNGSPMGEHRVAFSQTEFGDLRVDIDVELDVNIGPIPVFRYRYDSTEYWRSGELLQLQTRALNGGDWTSVEVRRDETGNLVSDGDVLGELIPSSHWFGYVPGDYQVLNSETGEPMDVVVEQLGVELFDGPDGTVEAERVRMTGTLTVDLWYDGNGRWIGCEFEVRGQRIQYRLAGSA